MHTQNQRPQKTSSLKGAPLEDIEALLPYLRGEKDIPPGWIIPVYDKNGKFIKTVEFP